MRRFLKILAWFCCTVILIIALGLIYLRETLGGGYRNIFYSPSHREYVVEIYVSEGFVGAPMMNLFVVDRGHAHYLGQIELDMDASWSPWTDNLSWSTDGTVLFCSGPGPEAAYVFGEERALVVCNATELLATPFTKAATLAEFDSVMAQHGEGGDSFFTSWKEDSGSYVWRDWMPAFRY